MFVNAVAVHIQALVNVSEKTVYEQDCLAGL